MKNERLFSSSSSPSKAGGLSLILLIVASTASSMFNVFVEHTAFTSPNPRTSLADETTGNFKFYNNHHKHQAHLDEQCQAQGYARGVFAAEESQRALIDLTDDWTDWTISEEEVDDDSCSASAASTSTSEPSDVTALTPCSSTKKKNLIITMHKSNNKDKKPEGETSSSSDDDASVVTATTVEQKKLSPIAEALRNVVFRSLLLANTGEAIRLRMRHGIPQVVLGEEDLKRIISDAKDVEELIQLTALRHPVTMEEEPEEDDIVVRAAPSSAAPATTQALLEAVRLRHLAAAAETEKSSSSASSSAASSASSTYIAQTTASEACDPSTLDILTPKKQRAPMAQLMKSKDIILKVVKYLAFSDLEQVRLVSQLFLHTATCVAPKPFPTSDVTFVRWNPTAKKKIASSAKSSMQEAAASAAADSTGGKYNKKTTAASIPVPRSKVAPPTATPVVEVDECVKAAKTSVQTWRCTFCNALNRNSQSCLNCKEHLSRTACRVFIGQLRKEQTVELVQHMLRMLCPGVEPLHIESHTTGTEGKGRGCVWAYLNSEADRAAVLALHKCVFVDCDEFHNEGYWVLTTKDETTGHCVYGNEELSANFLAMAVDRAHDPKRPIELGKQLLVCELPNTDRTSSRNHRAAFASMHQQQQQQRHQDSGYHGGGASMFGANGGAASYHDFYPSHHNQSNTHRLDGAAQPWQPVAVPFHQNHHCAPTKDETPTTTQKKKKDSPILSAFAPTSKKSNDGPTSDGSDSDADSQQKQKKPSPLALAFGGKKEKENPQRVQHNPYGTAESLGQVVTAEGVHYF